MSNTEAATYRLTKKGQVTIPKAVRDALRLKEGDAVVFEVENGRAIVRKVFSPEAYEAAVRRMAGSVDTGGQMTDEIMDELRPWRVDEAHLFESE